jgi:hypothetical protein
MNSYFILKQRSLPTSTLNKLKLSQSNVDHHISVSQQEMQQFTLFVHKIITSEPNHQGSIYSSTRGNYNNDLLFFNIAGNYRFCPRKGDHHKSNTVAILIDTKKITYAIWCKDAQCDNTRLIWNKLP